MSSPSESKPPFPLEGDGRFREVRYAGRGGMGRVWQAHYRPFQVWVAVKAPDFREDADPASITALFRGEVAAYARLAHANIVSVLASDLNARQPWCATRWVEGEPLIDWLRRGRAQLSDASADADANASRSDLPKAEWRRLIGWMIDAAEAMTYAHSAGVAHRDLTPANMLLEHHPEDSELELRQRRVQRLVIIDFGLTRLAQGRDPLRGALRAGTPGFAAPEVWEGEEAGPLADVFGLGAVLFLAAIGAAPPSAPSETDPETLAEVERLRRADQHVDAKAAAEILFDGRIARALSEAKVDRDLAAIIRRALAYDPAKRYGMGELADDLRSHQKSLIPSTRFRDQRSGERDPAGRQERFFNACRKRKVALAIIAGLAIVLLFASAGAWAVFVNLEERYQAQQERYQAQRRDAHNARVETGRTFAREGRYPEALPYLDAALADGFEADRDELERARLRILHALNIRPRFDSEWERLSQVKRHPDLLLIEAELLISDSDRVADGERLFREIADRATAPADRDYARGVLENDLIAARRHLRSALRTDYFHHLARRALAANLMICGEFAEAKAHLESSRALFPWDPAWDLFECLADVAHRDRPSLNRHAADLLAKAEPLNLRDAAEAYKAALLVLNAALEAADRVGSSDGGANDWLSSLDSISQLLKNVAAFNRINRDQLAKLGFRFSAAAPLFKSLEHFNKAAIHLAWLQFDRAATELEAALAAKPDAIFAYAAGAAHAVSALWAEVRGNHEEAVRQSQAARDLCLRAMEMPTLLPKSEYRYTARCCAMMFEGILIADQEDADPKRRARFEELVQSIVPQGRPFPEERTRLIPMITSSLSFDKETCLWLLQTWRRDEPGSLIALAALAGLESKTGDWKAAGLHAEEYLEKAPKPAPFDFTGHGRRRRMQAIADQARAKQSETAGPNADPSAKPAAGPRIETPKVP